jgi:hypothetical protein
LFALPTFTDPFSGSTVPGTIQTFPVGEAPIIMVTNRKDPNGLGQIATTVPACSANGAGTDGYCVDDPANGGPAYNGGSGTGWVTDNSYLIRNVWDQHPYPAVSGRFPDLVYSPLKAGDGQCSNGAFSGAGQCKISRRPLASLFAGNLCETASTAFSWPPDSAITGIRTNNAIVASVNPILRETLSGTYNTFEYTEARRFGGTQGNFSWNGSRWVLIPYLSEENDVDGSAPLPNIYNPLASQCPVGFQDPGTEGTRYRGVGTGEVVAAVFNGGAAINNITYTFFSFGNVSSLSRQTGYGYLMIDGIDPLFANYSNTGATPGQPAAPGTPTTWGELPNCTPGGAPPVPDCTTSAVWGGTGSTSYPHLRDGTYPSWSEVRMMCDTAAGNRCTVADDAFGAQALVQSIQGDIHFNRLGGVPDLLPMSNATAGPNSFNPPYGDVSYIRDHSASLPAGTVIPGGGPALGYTYDSFVLADDNEDLYHTDPPYASNLNPQTIHQTIPATQVVCAGQRGTNSPPDQECGGDVGGWIIPVPAGVTPAYGQQQ